jgi:hypothetical protein
MNESQFLQAADDICCLNQIALGWLEQISHDGGIADAKMIQGDRGGGYRQTAHGTRR